MTHCIFLVSDYFVCLDSSDRVTLLSSTSYSPTSTSTGDGGCLCSYLVIEGVELLSQGAVHVEPPVADEVLLVEDSSVGAGICSPPPPCHHGPALASPWPPPPRP